MINEGDKYWVRISVPAATQSVFLTTRKVDVTPLNHIISRHQLVCNSLISADSTPTQRVSTRCHKYIALQKTNKQNNKQGLNRSCCGAFSPRSIPSNDMHMSICERVFMYVRMYVCMYVFFYMYVRM